MKRGWFIVDERLDEHPKWERALEAVGPAAAGVWLLMVARCSRNLSDGHLTARAVRDIGKWQSKKLFEKTLDALSNACLIEKARSGGLKLVNYLDHQRSRASVEKELDRKAQNQQSHRDRLAGDRLRSGHVTGNDSVSNRSRDRSVTALYETREDETREERDTSSSPQTASPDQHAPFDGSEGNGSGSGSGGAPKATGPKDSAPPEVAKVFEHWRAKLEHPMARLDDKRARLIRAQLKRFSVDELCRAIDGCAASDFHMGRDPKAAGKRFDGLELILRDAAHVEQFIERAECKPAGPSRGGKPDLGSEAAWLD